MVDCADAKTAPPWAVTAVVDLRKEQFTALKVADVETCTAPPPRLVYPADVVSCICRPLKASEP